ADSTMRLSGNVCDATERVAIPAERVYDSSQSISIRPQAKLCGFANVLELWERQRRALFDRCLRLLGNNHADAEDAMSNATISMLETRDRLPELRDPRAWFGKLVYNACMDVHRRRHREEQRRDHLADSGEGAIDFAESGAGSPEQIFLRR